MECKPCGKTFTGEVCYQQHLQSEKHKRKEMLNRTYPSQNSANNVIPMDQQPKLLQCTVCDLIFNSFEDFQNHSISPEHAKNVMSKSVEIRNNITNCNTVSSSSNEDPVMHGPGNENKAVDESDTLLSDFDNQRMYQACQYSRCEVCDKSFSGPEPYKQHMVSELHRKKVELKKNYPLSDTNQSMSSLFTCEPCKKNFSGQIPYMQHMTSDIHKKKLQQLEALERFNASMASDSNMTPVANVADFNLQSANTNPFFCKICNTQCSGIAPYQQHVRGASHLKNESKAQFQNAINKSYPAQPTISVQLEDSSSKPNSDVCDGQNGKISMASQVQDYVLPELADKLRVMSTDELQDCIKVFEPNDSIDFDQLENKQMQIDSIDNDTPIENQIEIKGNAENGVVVDAPKNPLNETNTESNVFKICDICNVSLLSVTDALSHFESLEHFNKKWRSE